MSKIKVLQVLGGLDAGGAETFVMNVYRNIDKENFQFDYVVHDKNKNFYLKEIQKNGSNVFYVPKYRLINHFSYVKAWNKIFKEHPEYKIIHCHIRSTASIILKIAKKFDLVTICHSHSTSNGKGISSFIKKMFQKKITYYADYLLGCSKQANEWLYGKEYLNDSIVVNNAIDTKKFIYNNNIRNKVRNELKINDKFIIGQVGRLVSVKNQIFSLNLLYEYKKKNSDAFLLIVGSGEMYDNLKNEIEKLNLNDSVLILQDRDDINELLQGMDVFIMPSIYEGLPLSLVEAQAASLPCIISSNVVSGDLIDCLIKRIRLDDDIKVWIAAIDEAKNNKRTNRMDEIKKSGFDISETVVWFEKFYKKIWKK